MRHSAHAKMGRAAAFAVAERNKLTASTIRHQHDHVDLEPASSESVLVRCDQLIRSAGEGK